MVQPSFFGRAAGRQAKKEEGFDDPPSTVGAGPGVTYLPPYLPPYLPQDRFGRTASDGVKGSDIPRWPCATSADYLA
jgi:hypothetical protein